MAIIPFSSGSIKETLNFAGDNDFFQVNLIGGVDYVATVLGASNAGGTLRDPIVALYDGAGNFTGRYSDDSFALGSDPLLQFKAPSSGTYYLGVFDKVGSGDYTFVFDQAGEPIFFGDFS